MDISKIFAADAKELLNNRTSAIEIHKTDIRASGNQVEISLRKYFARMLPKKYYISHGHLIDRNSVSSPQLDIIISDGDNLPSMLKTQDGTEYIPYDAVYSIGEVKSTFRKSEKPISKFAKTVRGINEKLVRETIPNTIYDGMKMQTLMRDMVLAKRNKILNRLFTFMVFFDKGDFGNEFAAEELSKNKLGNLPDIVVILNLGVLLFGKVDEKGFAFNKYPDQNQHAEAGWHFQQFTGSNRNGTPEGNHLAFMYYCLLEHLANSYLEPPRFANYVGNLFGGSKSELVRLTNLDGPSN